MAKPRFHKRPDLDYVVIPEVGRVVPGQILEGGEFSRYCPSLLERLPDGAIPTSAPVNRPIEDKRVTVTEKHVTIEDGKGSKVVVGPEEIDLEGQAIMTPDPPEPQPSAAETSAPGTADAESAKLQKRAEARRKKG